jgi:hypothetical protein
MRRGRVSTKLTKFGQASPLNFQLDYQTSGSLANSTEYTQNVENSYFVQAKYVKSVLLLSQTENEH